MNKDQYEGKGKTYKASQPPLRTIVVEQVVN